jgi:uncharacterized lipoprotein YehR (DUF1307 family)
MDKKRNQLILILSLFVSTFFLTACNKNTSTDDVVKESQKTLKEQQSGKNAKISYSRSISKDEEIDIEFMMHDYAETPKDPKDLQETKDALIPLKGKVSIKIKEIGTTEEIDKYNKAGEGKTYQYIIYEFKGDASNPDSNTIHPSKLNETGWDPAPQFVTIINGEDDYPGSYWENDLLIAKGYDKIRLSTDFTVSEWITKAAVWEVDKKDKPEYAFKFISTEDETVYYEVSD